MPCILNAANEIAVDSFLHEKIGFMEISNIIEKTMQNVSFIQSPSLDDYFDTDAESRKIALEMIK